MIFNILPAFHAVPGCQDQLTSLCVFYFEKFQLNLLTLLPKLAVLPISMPTSVIFSAMETMELEHRLRMQCIVSMALKNYAY